MVPGQTGVTGATASQTAEEQGAGNAATPLQCLEEQTALETSLKNHYSYVMVVIAVQVAIF